MYEPNKYNRDLGNLNIHHMNAVKEHIDMYSRFTTTRMAILAISQLLLLRICKPPPLGPKPETLNLTSLLCIGIIDMGIDYPNNGQSSEKVTNEMETGILYKSIINALPLNITTLMLTTRPLDFEHHFLIRNQSLVIQSETCIPLYGN